jgi:hypothetical protein
VDLRAVGGLRLAQAGVQQRQFVADVAAQNDDAVGAFDFGQRQAEHFGGCGVGEIAVVDAVVDVARAQALGQAGQQRAFLVEVDGCTSTPRLSPWLALRISAAAASLRPSSLPSTRH